MRFWCTPITADWTWEWQPYVGVWMLIAVIAGLYALSWRRHLRVTQRAWQTADRKYPIRFAGGLLCLLIASDWPVAALGAGYLASVHMAQFLLYTVGVAPLLLLGTPEWMARRVVHRFRLDRVYRLLTLPVVAALVFNGLLVATHAPVTVDLLRGFQVGSFGLDMVWLLMGLVAWSPVISPLPEVVHQSAPVKMIYLFVGLTGMALVPGGFLVFADYPLYATYEQAPRVGGMSALEDQQLAGAVMKVGMMPVVWGSILAIWVRWFYASHKTDQSYRRPQPTATN